MSDGKEYVSKELFNERTGHIGKKLDSLHKKFDDIDDYLHNGLADDVVRNTTQLKWIFRIYTAGLVSLFGTVLWMIFNK